MTLQLITPVGRLVAGHPMDKRNKQDDKTEEIKCFADGRPMQESFVGLAFPKQGESHWKETEWGAQIYKEAVTGWPRGEYETRDFSWKITDGDSTVPNKKMIAPCTREGYPGHWVIFATTFMDIKCYHVNKYEPQLQIRDPSQIKRGDYCRLLINVKPNGSSKNAGMYINPELFELTRAGVEILTGASAVTAFGGTEPVIPDNALLDPAQPAPPQQYQQQPQQQQQQPQQYQQQPQQYQQQPQQYQQQPQQQQQQPPQQQQYAHQQPPEGYMRPQFEADQETREFLASRKVPESNCRPDPATDLIDAHSK